MLLHCFAQDAAPLFTKAGLHYTGHFIGLQLMGASNSVEKLSAVLKKLPVGTTEYMVSATTESLAIC